MARDNRLLVDLLYHNINNEKSTEKFLGSRIFIFQQQGAGGKEKTPCKSGGIYGTQLIKLNHGEILLQVHAYLPKRYSPGIVQVGKAVSLSAYTGLHFCRWLPIDTGLPPLSRIGIRVTSSSRSRWSAFRHFSSSVQIFRRNGGNG